MDPRIYLKLAPYAAILGLCLALWGAVSWGQGQRDDRVAAQAALVALKADYLSASTAANELKKETEHAIAQSIVQAREVERREALVNESRLRAAVAAERRDAGRLREQLAANLGRACVAAGDPAAAGEQAAAAIGDVLAEALRVQAELAAAAERHAGEVRALLDAWPGK